MFQFPSFAYSPYFTRMSIMDISIHGVAPFGNVRVKACLAARRTLSWPTPSFVASMSLGIRLVPYLAYRIFFKPPLRVIYINRPEGRIYLLRIAT